MLNRSSHVPNARGLGKLRELVEAMKPAASLQRQGLLLLAALLVAVCAYLLLLDRLGVPPAAMTDFPTVD